MTVVPVCGRAASAAAIASVALVPLGAVAVVGRPHATSAAPPRTRAARKPRRVMGAALRGCRFITDPVIERMSPPRCAAPTGGLVLVV